MSKKVHMSRRRLRKLMKRSVEGRSKDAGRPIDEQKRPRRESDIEMELMDNTPETMREAEKVLQEAKEAGVQVLTKTYKQPLYEPEGYGVPMQMNSDSTHSIGVSPHPKNYSIAKSLLNHDRWKTHAGPLAPPLEPDDRPLIDLLHEATFTEPPGLRWIKDKYALRMLLRKAHCFTLDDVTSTLVGELSIAVAHDLEATRQMAIPPFPVTWIDLNNRVRLNRVRELGVPLTKMAAGETAGPPVERVGWLIHPDASHLGYHAHYVCSIDEGVVTAPLSYWWHTGEARPIELAPDDDFITLLQGLTFGVTNSNVNWSDACVCPSAMHFVESDLTKLPKILRELMQEIAGELRHIWGFLVALGAGHLGAQSSYTPQPKPTGAPPIMKNGKPLLPLEHKVLHLHLNKKTPAKIIAQSITHHHNRKHDVRAHWRQLKSGKRVPVKSHTRGDERLGRIEKTYRVER
jgi:hypothetical protein